MEDTEGNLCLRRRAATGLLAGLWEFPSLLRTTETTSLDQLWQQLRAGLLAQEGKCYNYKGKYVGKVCMHACVRLHVCAMNRWLPHILNCFVVVVVYAGDTPILSHPSPLSVLACVCQPAEVHATSLLVPFFSHSLLF